MPYAAIIFDLDGTLLDTESIAIASGLEAAEIFGLSFDRAFFETLIGKAEPDVEMAITSAAPNGFSTSTFKAAWGKIFRESADAGIPLKPGVHRLLDYLDARALPRAVATNSSLKGATLSLERAGLAERIHHVIGHDLVAHPKPAPDVYLEAARRLGQAPEKCLAFEDSTLGARAALAAAMTVVHVPDIVTSKQSDAHHHATSLIEGARLAGLDV